MRKFSAVKINLWPFPKLLIACLVYCALSACKPDASEQVSDRPVPAQKPLELAEIPPSRPLAEVAHAKSETKPANSEALEIDWLDLMSDADRDRLENGDWIDQSVTEAHPGQEGSFTSDMAERQMKGFAAIPDFDNQRVKLAGYFVPLEQDDSGQVTDILFVPYFGACIHVPPPPANQIIYAKLRAPQSDVNMFEAYWLEGVLFAKTNQSELAEAGYTMSESHFYLWN